MPSAPPPSWSLEDLPHGLQTALHAALDKKALAPVILRMTELAGYTDWAMILTARSERQVAAIADEIVRRLKAEGIRPRGVDGFDGHQWDLLDYDDFIVHVFHHPVRTHFDLESMWSDAPRVELHLPEEVMDTSGLDDAFAPKDTAYRGDLRFGGFEDEFDDDDEWVDEDDEVYADEDDELDDDELEAEDHDAPSDEDDDERIEDAPPT
ncbi:MAG: ribosome silencing factor [Myxococcales bacterium]|nr:ribosome silencing factor [Myxococcales bacterium]